MNGHKYKTFRPPARVWIDEDSEWWPTQSRSDTEEYIRADLVDELVGALEECLKINGYQSAREMIQTALAKIKEET
jgi:hypothetical protein